MKLRFARVKRVERNLLRHGEMVEWSPRLSIANLRRHEPKASIAAVMIETKRTGGPVTIRRDGRVVDCGGLENR